MPGGTSQPRPIGGLRYMPGVDGLRALAVAAVVAYHLGASWLPGGYLGVDVFLVISGFLITSLLLAEHERSGRIDLVRFWLRRARRLLPAAVVMIAVVMAAMLILHTGEVARVRGQALAALAYVVNWHFIFADVPYFEQFGRPSVFLHLWSLSIEEQFYLVWPLALVAIMAMARWRRAVLATTVVLLGLTSTALAWALWQPFTDPSRIYYGTDTRAVALLAGVGLALAPVALRGGGPQRGWGRRGVELVGLIGLAGVLVAMFTLGDLDERLYRGGFLLVALASVALIAAAADRTTLTGRLFSLGPMVWLGLRSYSLYLWHWPVIVLTRPQVDLPLDGPVLLALRVGLMVALAVLSYRYIEVPFRRAGWAGVRSGLVRGGGGLRRVKLVGASALGAGCAGLVLAVAVVSPGTTAIPGLTPGAAALPSAASPGAEADGPVGDATPLLFVGDSVMLGASEALAQEFGQRAVIDARAGREFTEGSAVVQGHLRQMSPEAIPVIHLGNNAFVAPDQLTALLEGMADRPRVLLITVRVPLPWQDSVNRTIAAAAEHHANVRVIDWYALSDAPGLLVDGAHMSHRGIAAYIGALSAALGESASQSDDGR